MTFKAPNVGVYSAPREWTRVHPVSPYLGSGSILGFIALYWLARLLPSWVVGQSDEYEAINQFPILVLAGAAVVIIGAVIGFGVLSWRRNEYRIGDDAMYHRKGILFRQLRQSRLDRIEAVDVVQPLLARIFGLAQLSVQVAGGKGSGIELKFLRLGDAEALRNEVLALAAGAKRPDAVAGLTAEAAGSVGPAKLRDLATNLGAGQLGIPNPATAVPAAPERDVYSVPTGRLLGSVVLSTQMASVVAVGVALIISAVDFWLRRWRRRSWRSLAPRCSRSWALSPPWVASFGTASTADSNSPRPPRRTVCVCATAFWRRVARRWSPAGCRRCS